MTPMRHLFLLPLLLSFAAGKGLEEKKGPFENTQLDVPEGTPVPFPLYQFLLGNTDIDSFRLSGEGSEDIKITNDGWLYLDRALDWSEDNHYMIAVEALSNHKVVDGPIYVTINVLDINNKAPYFNQSEYSAVVRENTEAGVPFTRVYAFDEDDPQTPNARLRYSLVSQIPSKHGAALFQIDPQTGEISVTEEGNQKLKAREGIMYSKGDDRSIEALKTKFNDYCSVQAVPYDENPFFTCVERAEMRRRTIDPMGDPDYLLIVRVEDMGGDSNMALKASTEVHVVVEQNLWVNPGPLTLTEHQKGAYPMVIAKVQSNNPDAVYRLVQKERGPGFPFQITEDGDIHLTEELDREEKDMYILVVIPEDQYGNAADPPMEIVVHVEDVNDNAPVCLNEESVFEIQEGELVGSLVGVLIATDDDQEGTANSQISYSILSQAPAMPKSFSIDGASGEIQVLRVLQRKEQRVYKLNVKVSDPAFSTECKVVIKVIDVNNELPLFEKMDYGSVTLAEDTPLGHTVVTIKATDDDDPESGSSLIEFHISVGNDDQIFAVETDGKGVGQVVVVKPLDFESATSYKLQIDARNPEQLQKGLEYGRESTTYLTVELTDVDEAPEFSMHLREVNVPENITKGSVLLTVEAKDPEGKEIGFKLDGDTQGWLEIDGATGEVKTKGKLDRETLESFEITLTAYEKANPDKSSDQVVSVRLQDINDNFPKLTETQAFICIRSPQPVILRAEDIDSPPYSQPFTFMLGQGKKSPNWDLTPVDGVSAKLTLKKMPAEDKTFILPINIKDNAGVGVTQPLEVRVCNCTELGHCFIAPEARSSYGMGGTIGILAGTLGFCVIVFIIVIKRVSKKGKKDQGKDEERTPIN